MSTTSKQDPCYVVGKVYFEIFYNEDDDYKRRVLRDIKKSVTEKFNISVEVADYNALNPESGLLVFAGVAKNDDQVRALAKNILDFIDRISEARVVNEEWIVEPVP